MAKRLKECIKPYGNFKVSASQSTTYVEPLDDFADIDGAFEAALKVFGFVSISRAVVCEKNIDDIKKITDNTKYINIIIDYLISYFPSD